MADKRPGNLLEEIVWENPPEALTGRPRGNWWTERLAQVAKRPNTWAKVWLGNVSTARHYATLLNGTSGAKSQKITFPEVPGKFRALSRTNPGDALGAVYVIYEE